MGKTISEEDIRKVIAGIKYPAIDHTRVWKNPILPTLRPG
jgi:hypothetical protein